MCCIHVCTFLMNYVNFTRSSRYLISLSINRHITILCKGKGEILAGHFLIRSAADDFGPRPQDLFT